MKTFKYFVLSTLLFWFASYSTEALAQTTFKLSLAEVNAFCYSSQTLCTAVIPINEKIGLYQINYVTVTAPDTTPPECPTFPRDSGPNRDDTENKAKWWCQPTNP